MEKPFLIRPVEESDELAFYEIMMRKGADVPEDDFRHPINSVPAMIQASIDSNPKKGQAWLAFVSDRGDPVGFISTKNFDGSVYVDEEYRKEGSLGYKGIGRSLRGARESFLIERGDTAAEVHIKANNHPSLKMFEKEGYVINPETKPLMTAWEQATSEHRSRLIKNDEVPVVVLEKSLPNNTIS